MGDQREELLTTAGLLDGRKRRPEATALSIRKVIPAHRFRMVGCIRRPIAMPRRGRTTARCDLEHVPRLAGEAWNQAALLRAWRADAERLYRMLDWPNARRVCMNDHMFVEPQRCAPDHRRLGDLLQHQPTAHEPQRAHTDGVRNLLKSRRNPEQTLPINEGKQGSRSDIRPQRCFAHEVAWDA